MGSAALAIAILDDKDTIIRSDYAIHKGRIVDSLKGLLRAIDLSQIHSLGYTASSVSSISRGVQVDSRVACITAAKFFHPGLRSLLIIGAEKFGLAIFNEKGEYLNYRSNTSCAAGTGNFLDQQAKRLNLKNIQEFSRLAAKNTGSIPKIASRCSVFAKTDLIHAQQEGYSLGEICDGLSYGLAKNIVDAVFYNHAGLNIVAAGGVSLNKAVIGHIEKLIDQPITVDEYAPIYGAIGAALYAREDDRGGVAGKISIDDIIHTGKQDKKYYYPPLQLNLSGYPDFDGHDNYIFRSSFFPDMTPVEVDAYSSHRGNELWVYLGIDIGSTSTKAILLNDDKEVVAGFYTRTAGQPLQAVKVLFESIVDYSEKRQIQFKIKGTGTTGSGRKFTGQIIGADLTIDEITAHARAAYELNPDTDTIIEIGGQDSKFTTMRNGMVTFSIMNNVCAAGTGSFIEEQAKKLNCRLEEYSNRVQKVHSPMASDRCTVFMERDLNYYLMAGYTSDEILAAVLHSTRENYLTKVAVKGYMGNTIFFQGATAKNRALVAAFEQKLGKPIMVSRYCHLTGALGVALELFDKRVMSTRFVGFDLYKKDIPIRSEICDICTNHCKLKIAEIDNRIEAYGFLCGRDYDVNVWMKNPNDSFQLLRERQKLFRFKSDITESGLTIGIPAGLHLFEEMLLWRKFFDLLSIRTVTSEEYLSPVKDGKNLSGAEFCAPIAAMHGHVDYLKNKADYIFLPVYIEETAPGKKHKQYCYYTQFISSVIATQNELVTRKKLLMPVLKSVYGESAVTVELYRILKTIGLKKATLKSVQNAYELAKIYFRNTQKAWEATYLSGIKEVDDIHIVLLGRPYTVLSPAMNGNIPEIIGKMGIRTFFMDMLPNRSKEMPITGKLMDTIQWKFATKILETAEIVAGTVNSYPVLVTSFKCSPDSFVIDYFKEILEAYRKPYLILQLDEHDSSVGYETRIEAAIRAFRNHRQEIIGHTKHKIVTQQSGSSRSKDRKWSGYINSLFHETSEIIQAHDIDTGLLKDIIPGEIDEKSFLRASIAGPKKLNNKNLILPSWDPYVEPILKAALQSSGINVHMAAATEESIQQSLSLNTGQCLPLNIIVQNAIEYIKSSQLNPDDTALWIMKSDLSCNLNMFPQYMKKLLQDYGKGMEKVSVYIGDLIFYDFSLTAAINVYLAYMFGGYVRKIGCRFRPYEKKSGATNRVIKKALSDISRSFREGTPKKPLIESIVKEFEAIETEKVEKSKVAIFGDLYVRDNDIMNQNLIGLLEANGGEVITTPYSEYLKIIADPFRIRTFKQGKYARYLKFKFLTSLIPIVESQYKTSLGRYNGELSRLSGKDMDGWLDLFGVNILQRGESFENILKIYHLINQHPDLDLLIQTNPSYCCPSLITEAMTTKIEELTGIPVVTIEYDGTAGLKNEDVIPYLKFRKKNVKNRKIIVEPG